MKDGYYSSDTAFFVSQLTTNLFLLHLNTLPEEYKGTLLTNIKEFYIDDVAQSIPTITYSTGYNSFSVSSGQQIKIKGNCHKLPFFYILRA